jgi:hypothetical protein
MRSFATFVSLFLVLCTFAIASAVAPVEIRGRGLSRMPPSANGGLAIAARGPRRGGSSGGGSDDDDEETTDDSSSGSSDDEIVWCTDDDCDDCFGDEYERCPNNDRMCWRPNIDSMDACPEGSGSGRTAASFAILVMGAAGLLATF